MGFNHLPLKRIPPEIVALSDYEALARARLDPNAWAYLDGASADEITHRDNQAAYARLRLHARALADFSGASGTQLTLLGQAFDHPILLAPIAYQKLAHAEGEVATALGAAAARAGFVVSTHASATIEEIAQSAQAPLWFQLYVKPDRGLTRELVQRAEAARYGALVVTVDAPVNGVRNREQRVGFRLPPGVDAANLRGQASKPAPAMSGDALCGGILQAEPTWKDIEWLRSLTSLPVVLKGILSPEDAVKAADVGVSAVVVSNHGGRTLDTLPATIDALPRIAAAVNGRLPLLVDGGIRRGTDVLKALALGASAVMIGRPYINGLAAAGSIGVAHVVNILRAELEVAMALTGKRTLAEIDAATIWKA